MAYLNQVNLIGNVGNDPDIKQFDAFKLATFKVATTERFKDRDGNQKENTQWHICVASGTIADVVEKYIRKGMPVYIGGKLTYRNWTAKDGTNHTSSEIQIHTVQMLERRKQDDPMPAPRATTASVGVGADDDIPF